MIQMQIKNAQLIQNALNAFSEKISRKVVKEGVKDCWTPLLKRAKANARALDRGRTKQKKSLRMGHLIAKNLVLIPFKKQRSGNYGMKVWIKPGQDELFARMGTGYGDLRTGEVVALGGQFTRYYIPAAIEYGHAFPGRGGGKSPPKDVAAKPFIRPALDATLPAAPKIFERHLVHAIHEENAKR